MLPNTQCSPHREITKKELKHFQFVFDKLKAWKKSANNDSDPSFVEFWNNTAGKKIDSIIKFLEQNYFIGDDTLEEVKKYAKE